MPSTPDLHARLLAEIERRERIASAVCAPSWSVKILHRRMDGTAQADVLDDEGDPLAETGLIQDADHIALHDPADALRRYAHYRKVLQRHALMTEIEALEGGPWCAGCSIIDHASGNVAVVPIERCRERRDVAEALGIETGDADAQHP